MPARLFSLNDGPDLLLDKPILLVGRHPECDIQIDSTKISRRHCCIAEVDDYLVVRDLGSTNGIRINGVRVLEGRLKPDDELTIGGNRYRVSLDIASEPMKSPSPTPKSARSKPSARPARVESEYGLEAYEDPVPLAERVDERDLGNEPIPLAEPVLDDLDGADVAARPAPRNRPITKQPGRIADDIELAPASDYEMPASPFPPSQRHPQQDPVASDSGFGAFDP
jgi:predicted component of type VI protein secretion system